MTSDGESVCCVDVPRRLGLGCWAYQSVAMWQDRRRARGRRCDDWLPGCRDGGVPRCARRTAVLAKQSFGPHAQTSSKKLSMFDRRTGSWSANRARDETLREMEEAQQHSAIRDGPASTPGPIAQNPVLRPTGCSSRVRIGPPGRTGGKTCAHDARAGWRVDPQIERKDQRCCPPVTLVEHFTWKFIDGIRRETRVKEGVFKDPRDWRIARPDPGGQRLLDQPSPNEEDPESCPIHGVEEHAPHEPPSRSERLRKRLKLSNGRTSVTLC